MKSIGMRLELIGDFQLIQLMPQYVFLKVLPPWNLTVLQAATDRQNQNVQCPAMGKVFT